MKDTTPITTPVDDPLFPPSGGGQYTVSGGNPPKLPPDVRVESKVKPETSVVPEQYKPSDVPGQTHVAIDEEDKKTNSVFWVILIIIEIAIAVGGSILVLTNRG